MKWCSAIVRVSILGILCAAALGQDAAGAHDSTSDSERNSTIWGGEGAVLTVREHSSTLELDCADGEILEPLGNGKDKDGDFRVRGTFQREAAGPVMRDRPNPSVNVEYKGSVKGHIIRLKLVLPDGQELGPFTLHRGQPGRLRKCQ